MDRSQLKMEANQMLSQHFGFFFTLFIPYFIMEILTNMSNRGNESFSLINGTLPPSYDGNLFLSTTIFGIVTMIFSYSATFNELDAWRNQSDFENGFSKSFNIMSSQKVFWGTIGVFIMSFIFITLWSFLLVFPAFIKACSYSQAVYIYRDAAKNGHPIGILEAITKSRQLMDGHKAEYFVLQLSFIGWWIVVGITFGIAAIYVTPYTSLTMTRYYLNLNNEA
ncbi:DUF975 family protein [Apilactobacillus micheneri]|uniref:DUF975 family protein n=1 Tax=Apilactobacillus micheneri TaxID=1899430 RepID=UPI00112C2BD6|nr:DUF975 family protein [Apilactobacillus micheneri]TPR39150.1 DUF975 family protein [Apilactobacillus micheneri]TPR50672.1 DUF975 family protein [Apilactobacillus micheneri]